jgi:hypothetical protein
MKTKFTNKEIVHVFNTQTQEYGEASNLFFRANKMYSYGYHWLLGEFIDNDTIVLNNKSYSNSTSKHLNLLWSATSDKKQYFTLDIELKEAYTRIKHKLDKLPRARTNKGYYLRTIFSVWETFNEFHEYKRKKEKLLKSNYNVYCTKEYKELKKLIKQLETNKDAIIEQIKEQQQKEYLKRKEKEQKEIKEFFNYDKNYVNSYKSYLRLSNDKTKVETSKGIEINITDAKRLYFSIKHNFNIIGNKIGYYTIKSIDKNNLIVGCHTIPIDNVHNVGKQIEAI